MTGSYWAAPPSRELVQDSDAVETGAFTSLATTAKNLLVPNAWEAIRPLIGRRLYPSLVDEWSDYRDNDIRHDWFEEGSRQFAAALTTTVLAVRAWGSEPVLMTEFNRIHPDDAAVVADSGMSPTQFREFASQYAAFNDIIRRVAHEHNVHLVDLDHAIPRSPAYMTDEVHLTDDGSKLVSRVIAEYVSARFSEYLSALPE